VVVAQADVTRIQMSLASEQAAIDAVNAQITSLIGYAQALESQAQSLYSTYARLSGAGAVVLYNTKWNELVNQFMTMNPNVPVSWKPMPIKQAKLSGVLTQALASKSDAGIPVLLAAAVPGYIDFGPAILPDGNTPLPVPTTEAGFDTTKVFPAAFSAGFNISLLGACPINADNATRAPGSLPDLSAYLALNLHSEFELMARVGYHAQFNLASFYQRIESVSQSSHWFSTSSHHSLSETKDASEHWVFNYTGDANVLGNTVAEQNSALAELETSVREELYAHVLDNIGTRVPANSGELPAPVVTTPQPIGPFAVALRASYCWAGGYGCWAGWIIGGLNSLFGSGSASTNFVAANSSDSSRDVNLVYFKPAESNTTF
jgi:hypothetical protein